MRLRNQKSFGARSIRSIKLQSVLAELFAYQLISIQLQMTLFVILLLVMLLPLQSGHFPEGSFHLRHGLPQTASKEGYIRLRSSP